MTYRMFIDDERFPPAGQADWVICRTAEEAVDTMLTRGCPSYISFDHDLGYQRATGMVVAKWLVNHDLDADFTFMPADFGFYVHSMNPVGAANIRELLTGYLRECR